MTTITSHTEIQLGNQGRLVIPASFRQALGFEPGDSLIVRIENGSLILEKADTVKKRLKNRFTRVPKSVSLADELIAERREEARQDESQ
jgi:AbrB family looped-hinge helix DNA binding protein